MGFIATAFGNHQQEQTAKKVSAQQQAAVQARQDQNQVSLNNANFLLNKGGNAATNDLTKYGNAAINTSLRAGNAAVNALGNANHVAQSDLMTSGGAGLQRLAQGNAAQQGGYGQAIGSTIAGANAAANTLGGLTGGRAGALLDQPGGLYGGYQASPGYQYALDQSEQAINRAAAASGGRYSGATLKALQNNAIGLANQDYEQYVNNQNALYNNAATNDAYNAGIGTNLASLEAQTGQNVGALQTGAGNAAYNAAGNAANFGFGVGQAEAGAAQNYGANTAQTLQQMGAQAAGYQNQLGQNLGQVDTSIANAQANNQMQNAAQQSTLTGMMIGAQGMPVQYSGQTLAGIGNGIDNIINNAAQIAASKGAFG
jgi:hypothetical protein